jgi:hypothetical protein
MVYHGVYQTHQKATPCIIISKLPQRQHVSNIISVSMGPCSCCQRRKATVLLTIKLDMFVASTESLGGDLVIRCSSLLAWC